MQDRALAAVHTKQERSHAGFLRGAHLVKTLHSLMVVNLFSDCFAAWTPKDLSVS